MHRNNTDDMELVQVEHFNILEKLPLEVWHYIFYFLTLENLGKLAKVSKDYQSLVYSYSFFENHQTVIPVFKKLFPDNSALNNLKFIKKHKESLFTTPVFCFRASQFNQKWFIALCIIEELEKKGCVKLIIRTNSAKQKCQFQFAILDKENFKSECADLKTMNDFQQTINYDKINDEYLTKLTNVQLLFLIKFYKQDPHFYQNLAPKFFTEIEKRIREKQDKLEIQKILKEIENGISPHYDKMYYEILKHAKRLRNENDLELASERALKRIKKD